MKGGFVLLTLFLINMGVNKGGIFHWYVGLVSYSNITSTGAWRFYREKDVIQNEQFPLLGPAFGTLPVLY